MDELDPIVLARQGSFSVGGTVVETDGEFDPAPFSCPTGNTYYLDHAYVQYQQPVHPRDVPLVLWHGGGSTGKTWETTPDGRDGFGTLMVRDGWTVYIVDQPRRGRGGAGAPGEPAETPLAGTRSLWQTMRLGIWPDFFPGVQFDRSDRAMNQYWRRSVPGGGPEDPDVAVAAVVELIEQVGPAVLVTHSRSGHSGLVACTRTGSIRANVAYEPVNFVFPDDDPPAEIPTGHPAITARTQPTLVPPAQFDRLLDIPIQVVYGDNIPTEPHHLAGLEMWRVATAKAEQFADAVNRRGGNATVLRLPDADLRGNTHLPFADLNNRDVADLFTRFLASKGLDGRST